jgi:hypothetical protein
VSCVLQIDVARPRKAEPHRRRGGAEPVVRVRAVLDLGVEVAGGVEVDEVLHVGGGRVRRDAHAHRSVHVHTRPHVHDLAAGACHRARAGARLDGRERPRELGAAARGERLDARHQRAIDDHHAPMLARAPVSRPTAPA